ncbi:CLUMA_CG012848, isoform A [Clunio marinus]|uniref:CLUMA_CG012848, isoform A n=1 Tax=Clunio marinus TaxID=568069 RepID=A0A1J1IM35_9DIPT|nr:CLUMA_CG012848, isoform A [Clunio marinus]
MLKIIASTDSSIASLGNTTSVIATATPFTFDYNATEFWNLSRSVDSSHNNATIDLYHPCHPSNPEFNCSVDEYLSFYLGSRQMPLETAIWVTIFFVGIFATGVIGNLIVCVVIVKNASMHTATNYYLFSLAVSDLLFLMMGLPYDLSLYWHQYPYNLGLTFCKMRALISEASTYVSVLTIVAFSMERFLAICHPLHLYTMSGLQRAVRIIAALWVISFLSAVPFAVFTKVHYLAYPETGEEIPDSAFCAMLDNPDKFPLWEVSTCVFFAFPMLIMVILYGRMGLKIRSRTRHTVALGVQQGSIHGESKQSQSRKAIIRMLAAVVITFFVCWAPFHAQRLLYLYGKNIESFKALNHTINPILYNVMSHRYRIAFRETLCSRKRGFYSSTNGFVRDQSSFRETTIAATGRDHKLNYEGSKLLRPHRCSTRCSKRCKDHKRLNNSMRWKEKDSVKRVDSSKSTDSTQSTKSNSNNSSNVIVVCIGSSFKTKCFTTSTNPPPSSSQPPSSTSTNDNNLSTSSSPNHCSYKSASSATTNNKLNHSLVNISESNNGSRINCQMNNLPEENEDELEGEKIDKVDGNKKESSQSNGVTMYNDTESHGKLINGSIKA